MFRCLGGGFRQDSLEDEVAWLKRMLEKESLQRKVMQEQLHQEQAKCAILEQEIQQAAAAAHEMGESLRQFFSRNAGSDCSDQAFQWASASLSCLSEPGLAGDTPQSTERQQYHKQPHTDMQARYHDTSRMHDQLGSAPSSAPAHPHHSSKSRLQLAYSHHHQQQGSGARVPLQQQQQQQRPRPVHSSCSTRESQLSCSSRQSNNGIPEFSPLLNRQPSLSHKSSAKTKRHVLHVADQLKDLAISWQQRLEEYQPLHAGPAAVASAGAPVTTAGTRQLQAEHASSPRIAAAVAPEAAAASGAVAGASRLGRSSASPTAACAATFDLKGNSSLQSSWSQKLQQQQWPCKQPRECQASTESLHRPAISGSSQSEPPYPTTSVEWGSSSGFTDNHSGGTPQASLFNTSGDVSSSTGSFVRYRNSFQQYGVTDIAEGQEDCESSDTEQLPRMQQQEEWQVTERSQGSDNVTQGDQSDTDGEEHESDSEDGSCMTDEEAESQMLQWHLQQMEQQQASQCRLLTQQTQQQHVPTRSDARQQQPQQHQGIGTFSAWNQPSRDAPMPRCAITRGAASRTGTPPSSRGVRTPGSAGAAHLTPVAAGPSPLAAGATALRSKSQPCTALQQQQQQYKRQQQLSLRQREPGGADVIPRGLKSMAPLRRHQQYLGATG